MNSESSSIQAHLNILQNLIHRMAANSNACKFWCLTLVSAILVIVGQSGTPTSMNQDHILFAFIPAASLFILNVYYHVQELGFRSSYDVFVEKLHNGKLGFDEIYTVNPHGTIYRHIISSLSSFSIWFFYIMIFTVIIIAWKVIL